MANHMKDERSTAGGNPPKPPAREQSREEIRARQAAEKREKQEWIARRMREDQEAAEREAREKAEWIARRMREDEEQEAREKAALAAQRKRQQAEIHRAERRAEVAARHREEEAKERQRRRKAELRAARRRKRLRRLKIALLVLMLLAILVGGGWLAFQHGLFGSRAGQSTPAPDGTQTQVSPGDGGEQRQIPSQPQAQGQSQEEQTAYAHPILQVELPMGVSFELDRRMAIGEGESLNRDYVREAASAAVQQFREKTAGESYSMDPEGKVLRIVKGAGQMDIDLEKLCAAAEEALPGDGEKLVYDQIEGRVLPPDWRQLRRQVSIEPVDAHFAESDFEVIPGVPGLSFDVAKARSLWLQAQPMEEILIPMEEVQPRIGAEELMDNLFGDRLGSQTSKYGGSSRARVNNINLAVEKINGTILMPGETFSYNETVGQRTIENGFQEAAAYASGEVVQEVGGGICQVSSTLYCATLYSRMTIVSRTYHYFRVTYLPPGQDATVSWGEPDFKFRNDREYPVKIIAWCDNDNMELTVEIWGTDTDGIWVSLSYEQYAVHDTEYPEVVVASNVYLWITYHDSEGNVIETREGLASTYHRHDYEIEWPPEKFQDEEGSGEGEIVIEPGGGDSGGGDVGGGDNGGGDNGGDNGGGDNGGGDDGGEGDVIIEG